MEDAPEESALLRVQEELDGVEAALRRLDEGLYTQCEVCGQAIEADRLMARPVIRSCSQHPERIAP